MKRLSGDLSAYLDDFDLIRIYYSKNYYNGSANQFYLSYNGALDPLEIINKIDLGNYFVYELRVNNIDFKNEYKIMTDFGRNVSLLIGKITKTNKFDEIFSYDGPLGAIFQKDKTSFYLYSPTAFECFLLIDDNFIKMNKTRYGFEKTLEGNFDGKLYNYLIKQNGEYYKINDPYSYSTNQNGESSCVIDISKIHTVSNDKDVESITDCVIYEMNIRDFSSSDSIFIENKKTFMGVTEENNVTKEQNIGFSYVKDLGVTHLQLMPVIDYGSVDEMNPYVNYNWGYDPSSVFTLEGSYSSDPTDPYKRIKEFAKMISSIHEAKLYVVMDIVINHVFEVETNALSICVPNYYFQMTKEFDYTNSSYCGNDIDSSRYMAKRIIIDQAKYFVDVFKVDGFRYDLMGLLNIKTMQELEKECSKLNKNFILYGEGWNMPSNILEDERTSIKNMTKIQNISFFNDIYRDFLVGSVFDKNSHGFFHDKNDYYGLVACFLGNSSNELQLDLFDSPKQSINYVECHDNFTLYDKLKYLYNDDESLILKITKFIFTLNILSLGVPFIHSGSEWQSSKKGLDNSYNSGDLINGLDWKKKNNHLELINFVKDLLKIRSSNAEFRETKINIIDDYHFDKIEEDLLKFDLGNVVLLMNLCEFDKEMKVDEEINVIFNNKLDDYKTCDINIGAYSVLIYRRN